MIPGRRVLGGRVLHQAVDDAGPVEPRYTENRRETVEAAWADIPVRC
jgi:hypothetical protein